MKWLTSALVRMRKTLVSTKLILTLFVDFFFYFPVLHMLAKSSKALRTLMDPKLNSKRRKQTIYPD